MTPETRNVTLDSPAPPSGEPSTAKHPQEAAIVRRRRWQAMAEVLLIFCLFFVYAAWPAPDVNEAHYLCKVKQAWDPGWLPGDFFLNTVDAHPVFTWACGWPTRFLPLTAFAWTGRVLTWLALAWAWRRLSFALVARNWYAVLSAGMFVAFTEMASPAGEWVVGGFEAKGPAFALTLLGIEQMVRDRWNRSLLLLGAASAFHVLVGGWAAVAVGFAWLLEGRRRPPLRRIWWGLAGGFGLALIGLMPAILLNRHASGEDIAAANSAYVFWRLNHHLDPASFRAPPLARSALGAVVCVAGVLCFHWLQGARRVGYFTLGAVAIALVGYAIRFGLDVQGEADAHAEVVAALLRFYWFRLADIAVPAGAALLFMTWFSAWRRTRSGQWAALLMVLAIAILLGQRMQSRHSAPPRADGADLATHRDWLNICQEARRLTAADARFLTPLHTRTFHWYAERSEVVSWKDIPQDAPSIVEWSERIRDIYYPDDGEGNIPLCEQDAEDVRRLADDYNAGYIITYAAPPLALPRLSANRTYAIYAVPRETPSTPSTKRNAAPEP